MFEAYIKGLHQNVKMPIRLKNMKVLKNGKGVVYFRNEADLQCALEKKGLIRNKPVKVTISNSEKNENEKQDPKSLWPVKSKEEIEASILETGRLFIRNLSYQCTEKDLELLFSPYGSISDIHLAFDTWTNTSKGFAFVTFLFPKDAVAAFNKLDKTKFMDRLLHIMASDEPKEVTNSNTQSRNHDINENGNEENYKSVFQTSKFADMKSSASIGHNWNALFVRPDAVSAYLSSKFGIPVDEVLNQSKSGSVAVRLAHGETQLINEIREFLKSQGVCLESFDSTDSTHSITEPNRRRDRSESKLSTTVRSLSGTAFLIKNLPVGTTETEIRQLLDKYSSSHESKSGLKRVIVPPLGITCIVEYENSQQARLKYKSLAYEPYKNSVLFLQWLPDGALNTPPPPLPVVKDKSNRKSDKATTAKTVARADDDNNDNDDNAVVNQKIDSSEFEFITSPSLFNADDQSSLNKRNLDFDSTAMDIDDDNNNNVNYNTENKPARKLKKHKNKNDRIREMNRLQNQSPPPPVVETVVDSKLETTTCCSDSASMDQGSNADAGNRNVAAHQVAPNRIVIVRNVPFQATQKELTELFKPIGGLVNVRLPKKPVGGHRGFAFIEFATVEHSKCAIETLGLATHFLGRRLRLEYANPS